MLDLHSESGIAAIRECGLHDEFELLTGECAEAQKMLDMDGTVLHTDEGEMSNRPEISRHALSKLLSSHLPADSIKWGHKLVSAAFSTGSPSTCELDFGPDHGRQVFDLVIGADGAWSRVRGLLTAQRPQYAGVQNITLTVRHLTAKYPHLAALVGLGNFAALGMHYGVMSQRGPQDSARIYVFLTAADEDFAATSGLGRHHGPPPPRTASWETTPFSAAGAPQIKELVAVACDEDSADNPGCRPRHKAPVHAADRRHVVGAPQRRHAHRRRRPPHVSLGRRGASIWPCGTHCC